MGPIRWESNPGTVQIKIPLQSGRFCRDRPTRLANSNMDRGRRAMPVQNKACHERHVKKCQDNHRLRLAKMKPTIDCHAPSSMRKVASKTNAKKQQIMVRSHVPRLKHVCHHCSMGSVVRQTLCNRLGRNDENTSVASTNPSICQRGCAGVVKDYHGRSILRHYFLFSPCSPVVWYPPWLVSGGQIRSDRA